LHSILSDLIATRHAELVDAAIRLALGTDDLVELRRIESMGGEGAAAGTVSGVLLTARAA
jgi:hypothetical protein